VLRRSMRKLYENLTTNVFIPSLRTGFYPKVGDGLPRIT
jgi:hypothetical protein